MKTETENVTHTPGPWTWIRKGCTLVHDDGHGDGEQVLAIDLPKFISDEDKRLIAAAPDLLAALHRIRASSGDPIIEHICDAAITKAEA